ncbi:type II toxin-antitoxin system VapC family toxin [Moraxella sp. ZJ142]|uniref:type II toxin-antitoxin system VapC family toxin n=1 Tax=Moraxella marmotae TaxID=3344520 RepID=UPI0035D3F3B0
MKYLLDTNICIYLLKHQPKSVLERFASCQVGEVGISAITWAELLRGLDKYEPKAEFARLRALIGVLPFDEKCAMCFGEYMQTANHKPSFDTLIACHAKAHGLILVTNNAKDFERYDIHVENWVQT